MRLAVQIAIGFVLLGTCVRAQELMDAAKGRQMFEGIPEAVKASPLKARLYPVHAQMNLSFRFQAGYFIELQANQFEGTGRRHRLAIVLRVTPEGGEPTYLGTLYRLPSIAKAMPHQFLSLGGIFFLGEGNYSIELVATDDKERTYFAKQKVSATLRGAEKLVTPVIERGAVMPLSGLRIARSLSPDAQALKLTLLLHAAPNYSRSTVFRPQDLGRLLGAMSALVEQVPVKSLRVVAFNLDQQKEYFREDNFDGSGFDKLRESLLPISPGTVDFKVLQNRKGHIDLLADMIGREIEGDDPPDAVIVLGPMARLDDRVRAGIIAQNPPNGPRFFYFQYKSMRDSGQSQMPDTIESAMKRVMGKVFHIFTPGDFAKAIAELRKPRA